MTPLTFGGWCWLALTLYCVLGFAGDLRRKQSDGTGAAIVAVTVTWLLYLVSP